VPGQSARVKEGSAGCHGVPAARVPRHDDVVHRRSPEHLPVRPVSSVDRSFIGSLHANPLGRASRPAGPFRGASLCFSGFPRREPSANAGPNREELRGFAQVRTSRRTSARTNQGKGK
jgi:hypothetical protein